jgi:galactose mutarotase-like enzyme
MIKLENEFIGIEISEHGAEMQKFYSKESQVNYLWSGDKEYWGKFSPVLFPIVGSLIDGEYTFQDKTYQLPRHGFARDLDFKIDTQKSDLAILSLAYTEETLKVYPFKFELKIKYELMDRKITVTYQVLNNGADDMYFSIGAHPAFAVPNTPNTQYDDYYLAFNDDDKLENWLLNDTGLLAGNEESIVLNGHKLKLQHELFYKDALVIKTLKSNCISLLNTKNDQGLHFHFEGFPFFGIWAAKDAPFVCLEPWCGVADHSLHNKELVAKEGINKIAPGEPWERYWEVECF